MNKPQTIDEAAGQKVNVNAIVSDKSLFLLDSYRMAFALVSIKTKNGVLQAMELNQLKASAKAIKDDCNEEFASGLARVFDISR